MKIQDFGTLQMVRTDKAHFGQGKIQPLTTNVPGMSPIEKIHKADKTTEAASIQPAGQSKSFQSYLLDALESPFIAVGKVLEREEGNYDFAICDIHAEATSEKIALGRYFDGRVSIVVGTHTHVQTADETILGGHTAYITDVGMTGPELSVLGVDKDIVITKFKKRIPVRFTESTEKCFMNAVIVSFDEKTGKANKIERLVIR